MSSPPPPPPPPLRSCIHGHARVPHRQMTRLGPWPCHFSPPLPPLRQSTRCASISAIRCLTACAPAAIARPLLCACSAAAIVIFASKSLTFETLTAQQSEITSLQCLEVAPQQHPSTCLVSTDSALSTIFIAQMF
ncbi:hypothetical protein COCVIDRAFT_19327 [Bipolaris victoriae FI3]|uniref:Uncharacterized protein n=1 Tax=Bipolaris victoriae (strain FI3) TaxID=930091 RepID=W7DYJ5_BIPV3|nr:hypothetical protein COCVIDRAFT_19327 [Bipolaris victoriae FI3]